MYNALAEPYCPWCGWQFKGQLSEDEVCSYNLMSIKSAKQKCENGLNVFGGALGDVNPYSRMTDEEIRESIKKDLPHITDEDIDDYMETTGKTLAQYRVWLDRALAARRKDNPNYPFSMDNSEK